MSSPANKLPCNMVNHLESSSVIRINFSNKKSDQLKAGETAWWLRATTALARAQG